MEAQPNDNVSELPNELTEMLKVVVLSEMSEIHEQCIYKVPQTIRQNNPQAYTPNVISIGPFHRPHGPISDNNNLYEMEELKLKYLKEFLNRTNLRVNNLVIKLQELESKIRNCYAGIVSFDSKDFLKIIMVDACFIVEHFLSWFGYTDWMKDDPILSKQWLQKDIKHDLILLENQIPFFVLEEIYKLANTNFKEAPSFVTITVSYFQRFNPQQIKSEGLRPKHFTDLIRTFWLPSHFEQQEIEHLYYIDQPKHVYSTSQLLEVGLKFELIKSKFLFEMEFDNDKGVLKMSRFEVSDATERFMRNIVAFEECHISDLNSYFVQYFSILNFLINTEKDVSILVDKGIIVNLMGEDTEVATMVNNLCKNVELPNFNPKYVSLCRGLNGFYKNPTNKYKAIFVHEYFNTPWKIASTIAAVLLLLFTLIQTVCSIWSLAK